MDCNSIVLSAKSLRDPPDLPSGGMLQLQAIILASTSPVILGSTGSSIRFLRSVAASTFVQRTAF